jgi:hypothetical protein
MIFPSLFPHTELSISPVFYIDSQNAGLDVELLESDNY